MVLTRLYKVTLNTLHNYLGLTGEVLKLEIKLNENSGSTNLPKHLVDGLLQRLSRANAAQEDNLPKRQNTIIDRPFKELRLDTFC